MHIQQPNQTHFKEMKYLLEKLHETEAADLLATKTTSAELLALNVKINQGGTVQRHRFWIQMCNLTKEKHIFH